MSSRTLSRGPHTGREKSATGPRRFAVAEAGEKRDARRKSAGIRRMPDEWCSQKMICVLRFEWLIPLLFCEIAHAASNHPCSSDAIARARELIVFYRHPDETGFSGQWSVDESAAKVRTVAAITGKRRYDVLQVWGNVYKGRYRMRLIYAIVRGECVLMGEEILEDAIL